MTKTREQRIQESGDKYGNKAANLIELNELCQIMAAFPVQIPEIHPLQHDDIQAHLTRYAPNWRSHWDDFVSKQQKHPTLQPTAIQALHALQTLIKTTFIEHPLADSSLQEFAISMTTKSADLMVRSTGKEDDITAANPGGNTSIAAVRPDPKFISAAIGEVVASYFGEKSLKQRLLSPPPANDITQPPFMPVLLQRMIGEPVLESISLP